MLHKCQARPTPALGTTRESMVYANDGPAVTPQFPHLAMPTVCQPIILHISEDEDGKESEDTTWLIVVFQVAFFVALYCGGKALGPSIIFVIIGLALLSGIAMFVCLAVALDGSLKSVKGLWRKALTCSCRFCSTCGDVLQLSFVLKSWRMKLPNTKVS